VATDLARRGQVLVVGSINVDLVVSLPLLPTRGETVVGGTFAKHHGGKGANQAIAAARLGADVCFVGAVGGDDLGSEALDALRAGGLDTSRVSVVEDVATGVALIMVDVHGENQIAVASGANGRVRAELVERTLTDYRPAQGGAYLANLELLDDAVIAGGRLAQERGMTVLINPAPARMISGELIGLRPILVPNEHEAEALTGESDPRQAGRLLMARTGSPVVITLGARGAVVVTHDGAEMVQAPLVDVIDTTGAGDTFCGALAAEMATGSTLVEAARVAVRAASLSVTARGARTGMPTRTQMAEAYA
jgi:ribokinase